MKVACGVKVGAGVSGSMLGGRSHATGGSEVGKLENIPGGAVGDAGTSAGASQAAITSSASTAVETLIIILIRRGNPSPFIIISQSSGAGSPQ